MSKKLLFLSSVLLFLPVLAIAETNEGEVRGNEGYEHHKCEHHEKMDKRKAHCEENPGDERCVKMQKKMEERRAKHEAIREACQADPKGESCLALKQEMKAHRQEMKAKREAMKDGMHPKKMGEMGGQKLAVP